MTAAVLGEHRARRSNDALTRIDTHEAICAERWQRILERMSRLEAIVIGAAGTLIVGMGGLLATLLLQGHH